MYKKHPVLILNLFGYGKSFYVNFRESVELNYTLTLPLK